MQSPTKAYGWAIRARMMDGRTRWFLRKAKTVGAARVGVFNVKNVRDIVEEIALTEEEFKHFTEPERSHA